MNPNEIPQRWGADKIIDNLWVGSFQSSMNFFPLTEHGITHIINCTYEFECKFPKKFKYMHIKLRDQTHQYIIDIFPKAIDFISKAFEKDGSVLIHCGNGSSRSGTIAAAYVLFKFNAQKKYSFDVTSTIAFLKSKRPKIQPNPGFIEQLSLFYHLGCTLPMSFTPEHENLLKKYRLRAEIILIE